MGPVPRHRQAADRQEQGHVRHRAGPAVGDEDTVWRTWPLVWQAGGDIIKDGKAAFGGAPGEQAFGVVDRLRAGRLGLRRHEAGLRPDLPAVQQRQDRRWSSTGPWQLPDFIEAKTDFGVAPLPTLRRQAADDLGARHVDAVRQRHAAREGGASSSSSGSTSPRRTRAGWSTRARCRCARGRAQEAAWKTYQEKTPGLSVFVAGARRRAHEAAPTPIPAGLRAGRTVARRGAAQALLAAGRARTRRSQGSGTRSSPAES